MNRLVRESSIHGVWDAQFSTPPPVTNGSGI